MILDHKIVFLYLNLYCNDSHMLSGCLPPAALCQPINKLYKIKSLNMLDPDNCLTFESIKRELFIYFQNSENKIAGPNIFYQMLIKTCDGNLDIIV